MSNSPLVTYSRISPNRTSPRNHKIDTITIHCIVGQWTAKQGCDYFATSGRVFRELRRREGRFDRPVRGGTGLGPGAVRPAPTTTARSRSKSRPTRSTPTR